MNFKPYEYSPKELLRQKIEKLRNLAAWYRKAESEMQALECERFAKTLEARGIEPDPEPGPVPELGRLF